MATIPGSQRLLNLDGNNFTTSVTLGAGGTLLDSDGDAGTKGQILSSTGGATNWINVPTDLNNYVSGISFATATGILTLQRSGLSDLTVDLDGRYLTTASNFYLNGISKSSNTLTFSVLGATNQTYTFGGNAFNSSTIYAEPGIFSGGGTPTLASGVSASEIRSLIGAGTGSGTSNLVIGTTSTTAMAGNTTTITSAQATAIINNSKKVSDTGVPAVTSNGSTPALNSGISAAEMRSLIGAGTGNGSSNLVLGTTSTTAKRGDTTTITGAQATAIVNNTKKVTDSGVPAVLSNGSTPSLNSGISASEMRSLIGAGTGSGTSNLVLGTTSTTAKRGDTTTITGTQASNIITNNGKVGITSSQASAIVDNTKKVTDSGTPAILSNGATPTLNSGISATEVRTLIGAGTSSSAGVTRVRGTANRISVTSGTDPIVNAITGTVTSASTNLATGAQIQTAINSAVTGVLKYIGTWDAATNSPRLQSGTGTTGEYYIVSKAGSTNLDGITDWQLGDWAVFSDLATDAWQKVDNSSVGDITKVTAGTDLTGGGVAGDVTLNVTSSTASTGNTIAKRDASGDLNVRLIRSEYDSTNASIGYVMTQVDTVSNNYVRPSTMAQLRASLNVADGATNVTNNNQITNGRGFTTNTGDITSVGAGTGISGGGTSGAVTITNSDRGSSQDIFKNISDGKITIQAKGNNDTLTILGCGSTNVTYNEEEQSITICATRQTLGVLGQTLTISDGNSITMPTNTGPKGDTGSAGSQGIQGIQGIQGDAGTAGAKGNTGNTGSQGGKGDTGSQGIQGVKGNAGATGSQGAKGNTGNTGGQGIQGEPGDRGATGSAGAKGDTGAAGTNGSNGARGLQGIQGIQGPDGDKGDTGGAGAKGATGSAGSAGAKGDTGAPGSNGSNGTNGARGEQGIQGIRGLTGSAGSNGSNGAPGAKGDAGDPGKDGSNGAAGAAGARGATGSAGSQGLKGDTGGQGTQGVQGVKGDTGDTGRQGLQGPAGSNAEVEGYSGQVTVSTGKGTVTMIYENGLLKSVK